ncbi:MAG: flagellar export protein FliJ [Hydrogenophilales bacterium]|nr:flagellar export protein FliJ [Hydrogenophilales bacterium]
MPRYFSLQPLHDLAINRVEAATRELTLLKQQWQLQEDKLKQLYVFQEEYRRRLHNTLTQGVDMTRMRDFQVFLHKLDLAIRQQQVEIDHARMRWESGQRAWMEERRKLKTYDVLKIRHQRKEAIREGRIEQREQDEHARKSHVLKKTMEE